MPDVTQFTKANSFVGVDEIGLLLGLERLPGEPSEDYLARIARASSEPRDRSYLGMIGELSLQFGLNPRKAITISASSGNLEALVTSSQLILQDGVYTFTTPLVILDTDRVWVFKTIQQLVNEINTTGRFQAVGLNDGLAFQLIQQQNTHRVDVEITSSVVVLADGFINSTFEFHGVQPSYVVNENRLVLTSAVPAGVSFSYQYREAPFTLVISDVVAYSLVDPNFAPLARDTAGNLSLQAKQFAHHLAGVDLSYWGR